MFINLFKPIVGAMVTSGMLASAMVANVQAQVSLPVSQKESAFADYKKQDDPGVADWRASNDKVRTLGGWRTYLKEAYETPEATTPAPALPAALPTNPSATPPAATSGSKPAPSGHSHHHHGGEK